MAACQSTPGTTAPSAAHGTATPSQPRAASPFPHPQLPAHTYAARWRAPQIHLHPMHYLCLTPAPPAAASRSYISCLRRRQGQLHPAHETSGQASAGLAIADIMSATSQPVDVAYYRCSWCCWEKQHLVDGSPSCIYGLTLSAWCDLGDRAACLVRANAHASQNALRRKGPLRVHGPCACASYHQA